MAACKKNAKKRRAWIVFEDESGISQIPVVRRTWAPRGKTPVLTHAFNWKRLSMAGALAYRWDGKKSRFLFALRPGSYESESLREFLKALRRAFPAQRVILIWDGLPAHKSRRMQEHLDRQRHWLQVVRLPAYAPELNPLEALWGNLKGQEMANRSAADLGELAQAASKAVRRIRRSTLAFSFLRHAGLAL